MYWIERISWEKIKIWDSTKKNCCAIFELVHAATPTIKKKQENKYQRDAKNKTKNILFIETIKGKIKFYLYIVHIVHINKQIQTNKHTYI